MAIMGRANSFSDAFGLMRNMVSEKFTHEQYHARRYQSLYQKHRKFTHARLYERLLKELGESHTVDDKGYVVAYKNRGDEKFRMPVKHVERPAYRTAHFDVEFRAHAVGSHVGDFDAGEQCREYKRYKSDDYPGDHIADSYFFTGSALSADNLTGAASCTAFTRPTVCCG